MFLFKINRTTGWSERGGRPWAPANGRVVGTTWSERGGRPWVPANGRVVGTTWSERGGRPWVPAQSPPEREALGLANVVDLGQDRLLVPAVEEGRAHPVSGQLGDRGRG